MARSKISNGLKMLERIDGRSAIARRMWDIMHGLLIEFSNVTTEADLVLIKNTAGLAVLSEQLQTQLINGELLDLKTITNLAGQLRRNLAELRQRTGQHNSPPPPSIHEHLASFGTRLNDDQDDEDAA